MYFSLTPKSSKENLYNRQKELSKLNEYSKTARIILITGIRRVGKTSVLKVFLEQMKNQGHSTVFVDCRIYEKINKFDRISFEKKLVTEFENIVQKNKGIFKMLAKINVAGVEINFEKLQKDRNLQDYLELINKALKKKDSKLFIAFDEAQVLRFYGRGGKDLLNLMAHVYDNLENIVVVLTGSELGVLHDFLNLEDANSPLFGRYVHKLLLERFQRSESIEFLIEGFKQIGIEPSIEKIEKAVDLLDGITGYLSIYGYTVYTTKDWENALQETEKSAIKIVKKELEALRLRSENYIFVLKAIGFGAETFSQVKNFVEARFGPMTDQTLSNNLASLQKMGFLEVNYKDGKKIYSINDPMIRRVLFD
ncbi:AAA family ATPase [Thermotoga profunda]|uniref:AAA family ATPase n=1 Tax=Thermotoga profunda TaxID=1508420 RepID=UPI0005974588|nr:ATP-binding protein [Thermotoga profunda]